MANTVGILAYGSLIESPLEEIRGATVETLEGVITPFKVEFARSSTRRRGAPTLIPVTGHGITVSAHLFVLDTKVERATHMLYRREINKVGTNRRYGYPANPGRDHVVIERLCAFEGIDAVLYTRIGSNIEDLSAQTLARLAIESARGNQDGRDGITYLMNAKKHGIRTALSDEYEEQIKREMKADNLPEALQKARGVRE